LKPAKECVTTHLSNGSALKMDGADSPTDILETKLLISSCRQACATGKREGVSPFGPGCSADLGGRSKYSTENVED